MTRGHSISLAISIFILAGVYKSPPLTISLSFLLPGNLKSESWNYQMSCKRKTCSLFCPHVLLPILENEDCWGKWCNWKNRPLMLEKAISNICKPGTFFAVLCSNFCYGYLAIKQCVLFFPPFVLLSNCPCSPLLIQISHNPIFGWNWRYLSSNPPFCLLFSWYWTIESSCLHLEITKFRILFFNLKDMYFSFLVVLNFSLFPSPNQSPSFLESKLLADSEARTYSVWNGLYPWGYSKWNCQKKLAVSISSVTSPWFFHI